MVLAAGLLCTVMVAGGPRVARANDDAHCTVDLLHGLYVWHASGDIIPASGPAQPKAIVEWIRFNGDGTLVSPGATRSLNGVIGVSPPGGPGTYSVTDLVPADRGCQGHLTFTNGPSFDMFIPLKGGEFWMIQTDTNNVLQGAVTKVAD